MSTSSVLATVKAVDATGGWTAIASTTSVDRDNEVLEGRCFEPLPEQVPVRSAHYGGELVGSGRPYYVADRLQIDGRFASTPRAQEVRTLVKEGHLTTMSVVFMPLTDRQVDGRRHIVTGELLAIDWAEIPSQRDARVLAVRSAGAAAGPTMSPLLVKARLAVLEAEIALMGPASAPPSVKGIYDELARLQTYLLLNN